MPDHTVRPHLQLGGALFKLWLKSCVAVSDCCIVALVPGSCLFLCRLKWLASVSVK